MANEGRVSEKVRSEVRAAIEELERREGEVKASAGEIVDLSPSDAAWFIIYWTKH